jgi:hypothetical protein
MNGPECIICGVAPGPTRLIQLECSHNHCRPCLARNFEVSLNTNPFRPARCCSTIKTNIIRSATLPDPSAFQRYREQLTEYETAEKLYCHVKTCQAFIPMLLRVGLAGRCRRCHAKTCRNCSRKSHLGACRNGQPRAARVIDPETRLMELARLQGWKRCPMCKAMVMKNGGCNHIR